MIDDSLGSDDCTILVFYGCVSDQSQDGVIDVVAAVVSIGSKDGLMMHYDEEIKTWLSLW